MTDKEFARHKKRIEDLLDIWCFRLGLRWWHIVVEYARDSSEYTTTGSEVQGSIAHTHVMWEYLSATVSFDVSRIVEQSDEDLEYIVLHELSHILVAEMRDCMRCDCGVDKFDVKHEERVVTMIGKAFQWTRMDMEKKLKRRSLKT